MLDPGPAKGGAREKSDNQVYWRQTRAGQENNPVFKLAVDWTEAVSGILTIGIITTYDNYDLASHTYKNLTS